MTPKSSVLQLSNILAEVSASNMSNEILGKYEEEIQPFMNHCNKELDRKLGNDLEVIRVLESSVD